MKSTAPSSPWSDFTGYRLIAKNMFYTPALSFFILCGYSNWICTKVFTVFLLKCLIPVGGLLRKIKHTLNYETVYALPKVLNNPLC